MFCMGEGPLRCTTTTGALAEKTTQVFGLPAPPPVTEASAFGLPFCPMAWPLGRPGAPRSHEHPHRHGAGWADPELQALLLGSWLAADAQTTLLIAASPCCSLWQGGSRWRPP